MHIIVLENWDENLFQKDDEELTPNPSIDIEQYAAETDEIYLNVLVERRPISLTLGRLPP